MMVLPFGNMSSFMLINIWLLETGDKMSLEKMLGNVLMLRTVPLDLLLFSLGTRFPRLLLIM